MVSSAVRAATAHLDGPFAVLDLDALNANAAALVRRAQPLPVRVASKSVRVPEVLRHVLAMDGFAGILAYSLPEALALADEGFTDIVVAYPTVDRQAIATLASSHHVETITLMIDSIEHITFLRALTDAPLRLALDIDASLRIGPLHIGTRRSPIRTAEDALRVASAIPSPFRLVGLMSYEGQVAGVGNKGGAPKARAMRFLQKRSMLDLGERRTAAIEAVRSQYHLEFVNGGGTGSLEVSAAEGSLTDVAAGSGLYSPGLFDAYEHFAHTPALFFALPVVRKPADGWVTVFEGGWTASGAIGADRQITIDWPELSLSTMEGAGEVQTPLHGPAADDLELGDHVFVRHAKAGEGLEHMTHVHVVSGGDLIGSWETYRGRGWRF